MSRDASLRPGAGPGRSNAEPFPIDINYQKLLEWLITRQKIPSDWNKRILTIQAKANESIKEVPASVLSKLKGGPDAPLNYFKAVQIRDNLASSSEKGLFGGLTGLAGVWDKIVKAYERGAVYLGEAALFLVQSTDYDIPYFRKQAARLNQQVIDAERKEGELIRNAQACAQAFREECGKIGISSDHDIRQELLALSAQLPGHCQAIIDTSKSEDVGTAIEHYQDFASYAHGKPRDVALLPTLLELRTSRTEAPPAHVLEMIRNQQAQVAASSGVSPDSPGANSNAAGAGAIDWDLGSNMAGPVGDAQEVAAAESGQEGGIDWDAEIPGEEGQGDQGGGIKWDVEVQEEGGDGPEVHGGADDGGIQWDVGVTGAGDAAASAAGAGGVADWKIDLTECGTGVGEGGTQVEKEEEGAGTDSAAPQGQVCAGKVEEPAVSAAVDAQAPSIQRLSFDAEYRAQLMDDLQELRAFLVQRRQGAKSAGSDLLTAVMPESIHAVDMSSLAAMTTAVNTVIAELSSDRFRQLLMLSSSPRYLERMAGALTRKAGQEGKLLQASKETLSRKHDAKAQLISLAPKVVELVEVTRTCKAGVEKGLGGLLGRRINILGEINAAISNTSL